LKLRCFALFLIGIVQYSFGQNLTGSDLRGSSEVTLGFNDFSSIPLPEMKEAGGCGFITGETGDIDPAQGVFIGKGIHGVYLEILVPPALPEPVVTEGCPEPVSDGFNQVCHFDGSQRGIKSPVPAFRTGSFDRLFDTVGRKNAVYHRFPGLQADICDPLGNFRSYKIEMGCGATDHGTQADYCIVPVFLGCCKLFRK